MPRNVMTSEPPIGMMVDEPATGEDPVQVAIKAAVAAVASLPVDVEIVGSWVWLSGDTRPVKEELKAAGYRWSPKKARWYYPTVPAGRGRNWDMNQIRARHGSTWVKRQEEED